MDILDLEDIRYKGVERYCRFSYRQNDYPITLVFNFVTNDPEVKRADLRSLRKILLLRSRSSFFKALYNKTGIRVKDIRPNWRLGRKDRFSIEVTCRDEDLVEQYSGADLDM